MPTSSWSSPTKSALLNDYLASPGLLLALVGVHAARRLRDALVGVELSSRQFQLLGLLNDRGALAQQDLGVEAGVAPSVLVTLLNPLEADGFVRRDRDTEDRRRHFVVITSRGVDHLGKAAAAQRNAEDELFAMLDATQRQQLATLLTVMRDALTAGAPPDDAAPGTPTALERDALLFADADRRRTTHPSDPGGLT